MNCGKCGEEHIATAGHRNVGGRPCMGHANVKNDDGRIVGKRPCRKNAMAGLDVCGTHGGASGNGRAASRRRATEQKASQLMRRFGEPVDTTPTEALLDAVKWTAGYVAWLRGKVAGVGEEPQADEAEQAAVDEKALTQHSNLSGKREASVWVELLGQWHDRLVRICAEAIKAGIEERRVRIAEQQGALVADVIRKILDRLDLTAEQASKAGEVVPFELRRLAG